jgi:hypothetical protein
MTDIKESNSLGWKMWAGIGASFLYACGVIFILSMNLYYSPPSPRMELNQVGDYLAGAFSPLAFFWLVIGYLIQSNQIKKNTVSSNRAEKISLSQFYYLKKKEENLNQPIIFVSTIQHYNIDDNYLCLPLNIMIKKNNIFYLDIKYKDAVGSLLFSNSVLSGEEINMDLILERKELDEAKAKVEEALLEPKSLHESVEAMKALIFSKTLVLDFIDRTGAEKKATILLSFSNNKFHSSVRQTIEKMDLDHVD